MKNIFLVVLLGILIIPILSAVPLLGTDVWYIHYLGLFSFTILGLLFVLWKFNFLYVLFGSYCLFSTLFVANQHPRSILTLIQLVFSLLTIYAISQFTPEQRKKILWAIVIAVAIQGCWVVLQYFNLDPIFSHIQDRTLDDTVGSIGSHNQIGVFLATTAPVIIYVFPILIPLVIFGLFCSTTTSAWIAFIISSIFFTWFRNKTCCAIVVIILCISSLIFYSKFETISSIAVKERIDLVKHTISQVNAGKAYMTRKNVIKVVTCNPWFGFGLGNFMRISPYSQNTFLYKHTKNLNQHVYSHAHNDYAEGYFELGRIGTVILLLIIINFFFSFISSRKTIYLCLYFSCVLSHMISALGVFTIHTATSGILLVLFLGLFWGEWRDINV